MTAKTRSRRIRDQRKHLRAMGILLIVMAVFCVTAIGSLQLKQKNRLIRTERRHWKSRSPMRQNEAKRSKILRPIQRQRNMWKM